MRRPKANGSPAYFNEYKQRHRDTIENLQPRIYDSSQETRYDPWFSLNHEEIYSSVRQLCSSTLTLTADHDERDGEITNLKKRVTRAKTVRSSKWFNVAFLREQGVGKSPIINALFERQLVNASSSSSACTRFLTIISYRPGAKDNTTKSNLHIQYLNDNKIRDHIEEQARRHELAFSNISATSPANPYPATYIRNEIYKNSQEGREEDANEIKKLDDADIERQLQDGKTAKDFFNIIWGAEDDEERKKLLEHSLNHSKIECDSFYKTCLENAKERLRMANARDGFTKYNAGPDADLEDKITEAEKLWPLVKSVQIKTGHFEIFSKEVYKSVKEDFTHALRFP